ncbi:hypothetical protein ACQ4PT_066085 [Festuca glaucescens]
MARRRRRRAFGGRPELRLAYGARARPLGRAILELLPPLPPPGTPCPACRGAAAGCLACRRFAHLLRADDPVAYRRLVTRAVCAVQQAPDAPPPPRYTPGNAGHSQAQISPFFCLVSESAARLFAYMVLDVQLVRETTKWILADRSCQAANVLCNGIREGGMGKHASNLVSSSSWDILLHRVGDLLMCYILRHSSVFLPVKKSDYLQMAQNISEGNAVSSSKAGFYSSDNTQKVDALPSSGSCDAVGIIEPKCSERETKRYDVFYYPKSVWRNLTSNAIASLNAQSFRTLCGTSRRAIRHLYRSSTVRFLPKTKDMRPLINFKAQSKDVILNKCHLVIKKVRDENPEMFGSSVFDYDSIYKNLSSFISSVRRQLKELKVYIVVADVSKAFDCVNHDMLLKIMDDVLEGDEYVLRKCKKVIYSRSKNAVYRFDSNVSVSNGNSIHDFSIQTSSSGGILVDQVLYQCSFHLFSWGLPC